MSHKCTYDGNKCPVLHVGVKCIKDKCKRYPKKAVKPDKEKAESK